MRPIPIPHEYVRPEATQRVMAAPNGDLMDDKVRPAECQVFDLDGDRYFEFIIQLEEGDLEKIQEQNGRFALSFIGLVPPFNVYPIEFEK